MERVIKRYLMHNQGDSDDPKQNEFDDVKQDLQTLRYEIINDMKKTREDNARNMSIINGGLQFVSEEILNNNKDNQQSYFRYKELLSMHQNLLISAGMPLLAAANFSSEHISDGENKNSNTTSIESNLVASLKNLNLSETDEAKKSTTVLPDAPDMAPVSSINSMRLFKNNEQSAEEFYQDRLAYDFQAVFDDD